MNDENPKNRIFRIGKVLFGSAIVCLVMLFGAPNVATAAPITLVGTTTASGNSAAFNASLTALQGGISASAATDDLVVVVSAFYNNTNGNPGVGTAGYTELNDLFQTDTNSINFSVSYKKMTGTPDTTVSCNGSGSATLGSVCLVYVWRYVDTTTPMDVASTSLTTASSEDINCPSITPTTAGAFVMCTGGFASANVLTAITWPTTPAGIQGGTLVQVDPTSAATAVAMYGSWSGGAYDPAAWAITAGTAAQNSWAALTLALRPASPAVAPTVTTDSAQSTIPSAATLFGNITNDGNQVGGTTNYGFAISTNSSLSTNVSTSSLGAYAAAGSFSYSTTTLTQDLTYYYRAYASTTGGVGYGTILSFTTGNDTPARKMRLFEGFRIKVNAGGTIKLLPQ